MKPNLLFIVTLFFISCDSPSSGTATNFFEKGTFEGNTFSNNYFGFRLEIDTPWHILNKAELSDLIEERMETLDEVTEQKFSVTKGADILLSLIIDTLEHLPHVLISSLDISLFPHIKNEIDYLDDYIKQVQKMYEDYDVKITASEISQEIIGTKTFFSTLITIKAENFLAYQKRYSIKMKDRLLNLMTNYNSDLYLRKCETLLKKIKWD